jgi:hypothetical protein
MPALDDSAGRPSRSRVRSSTQPASSLICAGSRSISRIETNPFGSTSSSRTSRCSRRCWRHIRKAAGSWLNEGPSSFASFVYAKRLTTSGIRLIRASRALCSRSCVSFTRGNRRRSRVSDAACQCAVDARFLDCFWHRDRTDSAVTPSRSHRSPCTEPRLMAQNHDSVGERGEEVRGSG